MKLFLYFLCILASVLAALGQANVRTAGQLANALRAGQREIHFESTITGHHNESPTSTPDAFGSARYGAFAEVR